MTAAALSQGAGRPGFLAPGLKQRLRRPGVRAAVLPGLAAWGLLCALPATHLDLQICAPPAAGARAAFGQALAGQAAGLQPAAAAVEWALMVVAMMLPLTACEIGHLRARVYRRDRTAAAAAFAAGFLGVWLLLGPGAVALTLAARALLQSLGPVAGSAMLPLMLAALWMLSAARRRALARCHRRPALAPGGRTAARDALGFGLSHARHCATACLPLMLAVQAAGGGLAGMALLALLAAGERRAHRPDPRGPAAVMAVYGIYLALI